MARAAWHDAGVDDQSIVQAVLDGDRNAFRLLVERDQGTVYRVCLRILGRQHDAEDVAQESFVIAYRSLAGYRGDGSLAGWLVRIATRQAYRRLGQRRPATPIEETQELPLRSDESDPMAAVLAGERARDVRLAVASLPDPYRETITLRYFGEMALDEIAATTRRPVNTVKTHLRRGLERLRREIAGEGRP